MDNPIGSQPPKRREEPPARIEHEPPHVATCRGQEIPQEPRPAQGWSFLHSGVLEAGWLVTAFLTPLVVNLWGSQPFEPLKAALVRSLVWIMAGCWLVDGLLARRAPWRDLRGNPLLWPVLAAAGACLLATVLGVAPALSLWGSDDRAQGLLTILSYLLLLLLVSSRLRTRPQFERLVAVLAATGVPLVGLGLAQALGWRALPLTGNARSDVYATLGRSNFLGAYLAALLPLTVAWAWTAARRWQRLGGAILAAAELAVIGLTLARGAWLGAAVALAILATAGVWRRLRLPAAWRPRLAVAVGVGLVAAAALGIGLSAGLATEGSAAARRTIWGATLELIGRRPWLGYGPEALGLVFPGVYPEKLVWYQGRGQFVDRAHNLVVDVLAAAGIVGLAALSAMVVCWLIVAWRALHRFADPWRRAWLAACLAAVAASLASNLVSFDVTATAVLAVLGMALTVVLSRPFGETSPVKVRSSAGRPLWHWPVVALVCLVVGAAIVEANVRPVAADVAARTANRRAGAPDWHGAARAWEEAVHLWPVEPGYRRSLGYVWLRAALVAPNPLPDLKKAEQWLSSARDQRPLDWRNWAMLGMLYGAWGNQWDESKLPLAQDAYVRATALAPGYATLQTMWGLVDLQGGRLAGAESHFRQAALMDPTDGETSTRLGDSLLAQGRVEEALAAYEQAVHWQPELSAAHLGLARCEWLLDRREEALEALEQALALDPGNRDAMDLREEIEAGP